MKNALGSLLLAVMLSACVVRGSGGAYVSGPTAVVEVEEEPPPPKVVVVETRPGFVWVEGHWVRRGGRWVWHDGHYERVRASQVWVQGHWERRGRRHVWIEGHWERGRAVDHRRHDDRGPVIRDHRR